MADFAKFNPTGRFSGLAGVYARHRPDYPAAALDFIVAHCGLRPGSVLVDVGSGTGIATRQFAGRGLQVVGIEPNAEMRGQAEGEPLPASSPAPVYLAGRAEATGLADQSADVVLAAQAFHWFEPQTTLREFHRILKPAGWAVLMWNERDPTDPFTAECGKLLQATPDAAVIETGRWRSGSALLESTLFHGGQRVVFAHEQRLDEEGLLGRSLSVSYAPREPEALHAFTQALRALFARSQRDGEVVLRYETSVVLARK